MRPEVEAAVLAEMARPREAEQAGPAGSVRGDVYADADRLAGEQRGVFRHSWVPLARTAELAQPGSYRSLELAGIPLALVRGEDGRLRALRNVCRHRGAQILRDAQGCEQQLRCPYHGFTYDLTGASKSRPAPASFDPGVAPADWDLPSFPTQNHAGWTWVWLGTEGPTLEAWLGADFLDELRNWPLAECEVVDQRSVSGDFDWKVGVEAFLEPFHVPSIHARSAHPLVDYRGMAVRALGDHSRMALPFRVPDAYGPSGLLGQGAQAADVPVFERLNQAQRQAHFVYLVFPSTIWMLLPNHLLALTFLPVSLGRCQMRYELLAEPPRSAAARTWLDSLKPGYDQLLAEDFANLPWIQRGVAAGDQERLQLSGYEQRIGLFREALAKQR